MRRTFFIGIDVGGTNLRFALVDGKGRIRHRLHGKTGIHEGRDAFFSRLGKGIGALRDLAESEGGEVAAVGAGVPGLISNDGFVHVSVNLTPLDGVNLRDAISTLTGLPTVVANDVNAIAWGEKTFGAGRPFGSFLMVTLGTGVGGGLVLDGRLWSGIDGVAGEFGHVTVEPDGHPCPCGNRGCLEQYSSATAITRAARRLLEQGGSAISGFAPEGLSTEAIAAAARDGDAATAALFTEAGRHLGIAVASMANLLNLEAVIVGGGVAASLDLLRGAMERELHARAFPVPARRLQIIPAALGDDGGLLGSAALAMEYSSTLVLT